MIGAIIAVVVISNALCFLCGHQIGWNKGYIACIAFYEELAELEKYNKKDLLNE